MALGTRPTRLIFYVSSTQLKWVNSPNSHVDLGKVEP